MKKKQLTQKELKRVLDYNPETGVFTWRVNRNNLARAGDIAGCLHHGYRIISVLGQSYNASRLAFLWMEGYFPEYEVDHINRKPSDDRWVNLRHVTRLCNIRNTSIAKNNTSGIKGVTWHKQNKDWRARIGVLNSVKYLGSYPSKLEAAKARWSAEKKYGFTSCDSNSSALGYIKKHQKEGRKKCQLT